MSGFELTEKQLEAMEVLAADATHSMLYGGSRSGKTFILCRAVIMRALKCPKSRHAILRFRFNHVVSSIVMDTFPKVIELAFPGLEKHCKLDKQLWVYRFANNSEIWFGGLDDKQRTEKILGQEYSTIYLNECSQISLQARDIALTRLAQNVGLKRRFYYDCNPPTDQHWTNKLFIKKQYPDTGKPLANTLDYNSLVMNPIHNLQNLDPEYLKSLEGLPPKMRARFLEGIFVPAAEGALFTLDNLELYREEAAPTLVRIIIAVDPSGSKGEEDYRSDECGIVVAGIGVDGYAYILEDLSGRYGPSDWGRIVGAAFDRWEADCVIGEVNFGGAMVQQTIRTARPGTPFKAVRASRGKHVRAEPVAALYEAGKVRHVGTWAKLEDQLCSFTAAGYTGSRSPDRADAAIWAIHELFPSLTKLEQIVKAPAPRLDNYVGPGSWMGNL